MLDIPFTPAHEQALRSQVIDATHPGAVLHDFGVVLDYIGDAGGVQAGGKYNLLPLEAIPVLDERLARPLRLDLKRPQLRSHPYLQGLHLLGRASGLVRVEGSGEKARLVVDPPTLQAWGRLNLTERYFTLLEAWLLFGRPEMVGERGGSLADLSLYGCLMTWRHVPAKGETYDLKKGKAGRRRSYWGGVDPLALMDLFGLLRVEHGPDGLQAWCPAGVYHTPFGDAVCALLDGWFEENDYGLDLEDDAGPAEFGTLQPLLGPYFPAWENNLVVEPTGGGQEGVFVFKVSLGKVWRRIALRHDHTLADLVSAVLDSVDFDEDHLYEVSYRDERGRTVRALHPYCEEGLPADEVELGELPLQPGDTMNLTYDFGDNWRFAVKLEGIDPPGSIKKLPKVIEAKGKAPEQYPEWD
jgi:hypothetical protein